MRYNFQEQRRNYFSWLVTDNDLTMYTALLFKNVSHLVVHCRPHYQKSFGLYWLSFQAVQFISQGTCL